MARTALMARTTPMARTTHLANPGSVPLLEVQAVHRACRLGAHTVPALRGDRLRINAALWLSSGPAGAPLARLPQRRSGVLAAARAF